MTASHFRSAACTAALLLLCVLAGCHSRREQQGCRMQREVVIGNSSGIPKDVGVARGTGGNLLAAWSADGETFAAVLEPASLRVAWRQRIERFKLPAAGAGDEDSPKTFWPESGRSSPDAEDLEVLALPGGRQALAMLERPAGALPGGAYLALVDSSPGKHPVVVRVGAAWPFASRIDAAVHGRAIFVAWHEGQPDSSRVKLAVVDSETARITEQGVIPGDLALSGPAVAAGPKGAAVAWSRTTHRDGSPVSEVRAASLGSDLTVGEATVVASCRYLDPAPHLVALGDRFGLAYRDDSDEDGKPEFYFAVLDRRGKVVKGPARISRADGFQGPNLAGGERLVYSAAIRSFQRNYLVGLNRFDLAGVKRGGEFQVYADKSDFIRVAVEARGNEVVLVYGEDRRGSGRVLASRVICQDGGGASP